MRAPAAFLLAGLLAAALGTSAMSCRVPCASSHDCARGELCDLEGGDCKQGCTADQDCTSGRCDEERGICGLKLLELPDGAAPAKTDAGTSTQADGG